ncbi:hypothetical protein JCM11251_002367 [Rhodosporidiobolus azoricus]
MDLADVFGSTSSRSSPSLHSNLIVRPHENILATAMSSTSPDLNPASLGDIQPPAHLAQRLNDERERSGHSGTLDADLASHAERHQAILNDKVSHAHEAVEHAKHVAATHPSDPKHNIPEGAQEKDLQEGVNRVEAKRKSLERQQAELNELSERLRQADEAERQLRARLGEA